MLAAISQRELTKISHSSWFVFGLTHFGPKKYTFIAIYCQQVNVADSFKRSYFLAHVSHKNSKIIIFLANLVCITKGDKWVKFGLLSVELLKIFQ